MKKNKIYLKDWLELKPYDRQYPSDGFYLKICNKVIDEINRSEHYTDLQTFLTTEDFKKFSCFLTSYFEDIISETNIWASFIEANQTLIQKQLPFYDLAEYYENDINPQDLALLIWYFLNTVQESRFLSPYNDYILSTAFLVIEIFVEAWEFAPENEHLKTFYKLDENETDYYVARKLIDTLLFQTYLFYPDTALKLNHKVEELLSTNPVDDQLITLLNDNRDDFVQNARTRLLSLSGKEWAANILGKEHPLHKAYLNLSQKINGLFFYKGQDEHNLFIEHIASSKKFEVTKKSFDHSHELREVDTLVFMGIAKWMKEWWFSGVFFQTPFNANVVLDEKNSFESRLAVSFLDQDKTKETIELQMKAFIEFNKGLPIAFLSAEEINAFMNDYRNFYNNSLGLSTEEKQEALQRTKNDGFFGGDKKKVDFAETDDTGLVYFNKNRGMEIAQGITSAFPLKNNPYFDSNKHEEALTSLLTNEDFSVELVHYCLDNCKNNLPFFSTTMGQAYLENIDFLLRFWKKRNYHAQATIALTGRSS